MHTAVLHQADQMHHAQHYALDRRVEQAPKERLEGHLIADRLDEIRRMGVAHLLRAVGPRDAMLARGAPAHLRPRPRTSTVARTLRPARASARARGCQAVRAVIPGTTMAPRAPASPAAEPVGDAPTRALVTGRRAWSTARGSSPRARQATARITIPARSGRLASRASAAPRPRGRPRKGMPTALTKQAAARAPVRPRALPASSAPPPTPAAPPCRPTPIST